MPHADGHWTESKVNPGWYYGFGKNNPNPINQPAPEPDMKPNITNQAEYNRNINRSGNRNALYKVYGTNEPYNGKTVKIGGYLYSTAGGALEGNSYQLLAADGSDTFGFGDDLGLDGYEPSGFGDDLGLDGFEPSTGGRIAIGSGTPTQPASSDNNPVIRLFQAPSTPRYQRSDNNQLVPIGANLHEHADGTIMTEHGMGPQDNSVVVITVIDETIGDGTPVSQTQPPRIVPPLPNGTCPVGYNLIDGNCIHHTGNMGFGANTSLGGGGNSGGMNQGGGSY